MAFKTYKERGLTIHIEDWEWDKQNKLTENKTFKMQHVLPRSQRSTSNEIDANFIENLSADNVDYINDVIILLWDFHQTTSDKNLKKLARNKYNELAETENTRLRRPAHKIIR